LGSQLNDRSNIIADILEQFVQGVVMFDSDRRLVVWNQRYENILQFPKDFLHAGQANFEMALYLARRGDFGDGDPETLVHERLELLWGGSVTHADITVVHDKIYDLLFHHTEDGGMVVTYTDITETRRIEKALRDSEARFKGFVETAADWYWETDEDDRFTYFSENFLGGGGTVNTGDLLGTTRAERLQKANVDPEAKAGHLADLAAHRLFRNLEYSVDDILYVTVSGDPVFNADGEFCGYRGVGRDITDRILAQREITERTLSEERQREQTGIVQLMQRTAAATNEAATIEEALKNCLNLICAYIGWPMGHSWLLDRHNKNLLAPTDIWHLVDQKKYADFRQITRDTKFSSGDGLPGWVLASGKSEWIADLGDGAIFPRGELAADLGVKSGFALPLLVNHKVVGVLEFFAEETLDIDSNFLELTPYLGTQIGRIVERIWAEEDLIEAKNAAEAANQAKTAFLSSISHELRTPLNSIIGFGQLLSSDPDDPLTEDQSDSIAHITSSGRQLLELIDVILDLSKIESGDVNLIIDDVSPMGIVDELMPRLEEMASTRDIRFTTPGPDAWSLMVKADHVRLDQILSTILEYALKQSPDGGTITIDLTPSKTGQLRISVSDNGEEVDKDRKDSMFRPFANLEMGYGDQEGIDPGLALVRSLITRLGGNMGLESKPNAGNTFWFELPVAQKIPESDQ
jgi:PAS domain S-box-containing protein